MNKPRFVVDTYDVSIEHPSDWSIERKVVKSSQETLSGSLTEDVFYRKYIYTLKWSAMSVSDFDDILEVVNYCDDNDLTLTFIYDKFPQTDGAGTNVRVDLNRRDRTGGSGVTNYLSNVEIVMTEVGSR